MLNGLGSTGALPGGTVSLNSSKTYSPRPDGGDDNTSRELCSTLPSSSMVPKLSPVEVELNASHVGRKSVPQRHEARPLLSVQMFQKVSGRFSRW